MFNRSLLAHFALLLTATIYGANYIIAKDVMNGGYLHPSAFILLRIIGAGLLFWLVRIFVRERIQSIQDWVHLLVCGFFGVAANQLLFFHGLALTSPINAALIMTTTPILVLMAAAILLKEPITYRKSIGIALGAVGAALIILRNGLPQWQEAGNMGDIFIFLNALCYGVYLVLIKPLMLKYRTITVITWVFSFGLVFVAPFGVPNLLQTDFSSFGMGTWASVAYVVICTTFLAYFFNAFALSRLSPPVVSAYIYLQPLLATVFALWLQRDVLSIWKIVGGLLIFAGVYLVSMRTKSKS